MCDIFALLTSISGNISRGKPACLLLRKRPHLTVQRLSSNEAAWRLQIEVWQNGRILNPVVSMPHSLSHQRPHTKMVKQVFKIVTRQYGLPYPQVFRRFVAEEGECTEWFWTAFYNEYPDSPYHYVAFCHTLPAV